MQYLAERWSGVRIAILVDCGGELLIAFTNALYNVGFHSLVAYEWLAAICLTHIKFKLNSENDSLLEGKIFFGSVKHHIFIKLWAARKYPVDVEVNALICNSVRKMFEKNEMIIRARRITLEKYSKKKKNEMIIRAFVYQFDQPLHQNPDQPIIECMR